MRIAGTILHPTVFTHDDGVAMPWEMFLAFCICLGGVPALAATFYRVELAGKRIDASLKELREQPRMTSAEKYVLAAYLVFLGAVLAYLVIIALKVGRLEQELADLARLARERRGG